EKRAAKSPILFDKLTRETQRDLKKGNVQLGWSSDMVEVALGKPNRRYLRKTDQGEVIVWAYSGVETKLEKQMVQGTFRFRDKDRRFQTATDNVFVDVNRHIEYDRLRVEIRNDRVVGIEEVESKPTFF
ncbi:MAG: hypothetical protein AAF492_17985, partial [Verrucomicrobiota bacterium]